MPIFSWAKMAKDNSKLNNMSILFYCARIILGNFIKEREMKMIEG